MRRNTELLVLSSSARIARPPRMRRQEALMRGRALLLLACWAGAAAGKLACVGEDGRPVDWWLALKSPGTDSQGNTKYGYLDSGSAKSGGAYVWREGTQINGTSDNPAAASLAPLYAAGRAGNSSVGYVLWNDEPPTSHCSRGCATATLAHAKGVLAWERAGGLWLTHSIPKFPDSPADAAFQGINSSQTLNGQHLLCLSLAPAAVETVAAALSSAYLNVYSPKNATGGQLSAAYPAATRLASADPGPASSFPGTPGTGGPVSNATARLAVGGDALVVFTKASTNAALPLRLWEDLVEPQLGAGLRVQTWPEGPRLDFPSFCGPPDAAFASLTVTNVSVPGTPLRWLTRAGRYRDHSKWGVAAANSSVRAFCAGDNNRATPQNLRGGAAVCFTGNAALHAALSAVVAGTTPCGSAAAAPKPAVA